MGLAAGVVLSCGGTTETSSVANGGSSGVGGSGGGGVGGSGLVPDAGPSSLEGLAFDIQIAPSDAGEWCQGDCVPATFLVTKDSDDTIEGVWGATGRAGALSLVYGNIVGSLQLGKLRTWSHAMCDNETNLGPAHIDFADHDGDGKVDLVITGTQSSKYCSDDYTANSTSEVSLTGQPDARVPKAIGPSAKFEPVHGASIKVDKPLEGGATGQLVPVGGGDSIALLPAVMNGYVVGFDTTQVLPLGVTYTTKMVGKDFSGIGTPGELTLQTLDDPGVLVQDGFESGSLAGIDGATVEESFGVPALAGKRMLVVPEGKQVLLHLQRAGDEKKLVMQARKYVACWGMNFDGAFALQAGVVGATELHSGSLSLGTNTTQSDQIVVGELQTVTIDLPEAGEDVLVYMKGDDYMGAGCSMVGALIDELKTSK